MKEFEIGDKVKHRYYGKGIVIGYKKLNEKGEKRNYPYLICYEKANKVMQGHDGYDFAFQLGHYPYGLSKGNEHCKWGSECDLELVESAPIPREAFKKEYLGIWSPVRDCILTNNNPICGETMIPTSKIKGEDKMENIELNELSIVATTTARNNDNNKKIKRDKDRAMSKFQLDAKIRIAKDKTLVSSKDIRQAISKICIDRGAPKQYVPVNVSYTPSTDKELATTKVTFADKYIVEVKQMKGDNDSLESALAIAIAKKMFGMSNFKKMVNAPEIARKINNEGKRELKNLEKQTKRTTVENLRAYFRHKQK